MDWMERGKWEMGMGMGWDGMDGHTPPHTHTQPSVGKIPRTFFVFVFVFMFWRGRGKGKEGVGLKGGSDGSDGLMT
jgi:hypothetical protein